MRTQKDTNENVIRSAQAIRAGMTPQDITIKPVSDMRSFDARKPMKEIISKTKVELRESLIASLKTSMDRLDVRDQDLADLSGYTKQYISSILNTGRDKPSVEMLISLHLLIGVHPTINMKLPKFHYHPQNVAH